jgi:hypothetical protein
MSEQICTPFDGNCLPERRLISYGGNNRTEQACVNDDASLAEEPLQRAIDREWKTTTAQALDNFRRDINDAFPKIDLDLDSKLSKDELKCARTDPSFDKRTADVVQWLGWEVDNSIANATNFDLIKGLNQDQDGLLWSEQAITEYDISCLNEIIQTAIKTPDLDKKCELDENVGMLSDFLKKRFKLYSDNSEVLSINKLSCLTRDENRSPDQHKEIQFILNNKKVIQDGYRDFPFSDRGIITKWALERYLDTLKQEKRCQDVAVHLNSMLNRKKISEHSRYYSPNIGDTLNIFQTVVQEGKALL